MTREEFHRIYEQSPRLKHVQLVEGVVYMPSPIRIEGHGEAQAVVIAWLTAYAAGRPDVRVSGPATLLLDRDNEPEPGAVLFRRREAGGSAIVTADDYLEGAPELVVEIAASSRSIDLGDKYRAYRRNGVREYIVWVTGEDRLLWYALEDGDYAELAPGADGIIESRVFPGLRLDVQALLRRDIPSVLATQSAG
jgi:Uma2 family endonuclease